MCISLTMTLYLGLSKFFWGPFTSQVAFWRPFTFCDKMVVATHNVRLFILSTNLRILTALCLYFGFCQACSQGERESITLEWQMTKCWHGNSHCRQDNDHYQHDKGLLNHMCNNITWFSSSAGLIFAKRVKSMMVICLATSSGSKSKIVRTGDGLQGIYGGGRGRYQGLKRELRWQTQKGLKGGHKGG